MTTTLQNIVNVTVDLQTQGVTRKSFGIPCVLGYTTALAALATEYNMTTALRDLDTDGVWIDSPIYRTVAALAASTNSPEKVIVGKLQYAFQQDGTITVVPQDYLGVTGDIDPATVYAFSVWAPPQSAILPSVETAVSITAGATATETSVATAMAAAVDAVTDITASGTLGVVTWDADNTGEMFRFTGLDERQLTFEDTTVDSSLIAGLTAVRNVNNDWYGLLLADPNSKARVALLSGSTADLSANEQIFGYTTHDGEVGDSTVSDDVMSALQATSNIRAFGIYSGDQAYPAAATWMSSLFTKDPGSATWCYKTLPGITVDDLTSAFTGQVLAKGGNWYETIAGLNLTQTGQVSSAEWIDIVRGRDWLVARLRERIANLLFNAPKIPYTDPGIAMIEAQVEAQLQEGISQGYIAADPEPVVTVPAAADVATADKTARVLRDVLFTATLQGAIHKVVINGVLKS